MNVLGHDYLQLGLLNVSIPGPRVRGTEIWSLLDHYRFTQLYAKIDALTGMDGVRCLMMLMLRDMPERRSNSPGSSRIIF